MHNVRQYGRHGAGYDKGTMSDEMTNSLTDTMIKRIGCILMASGSSVRYGKNKLMEKLDGREIILHTAGNLMEAGFGPLAVTRSEEVKELLDREGSCPLPCGSWRTGSQPVLPGR